MTISMVTQSQSFSDQETTTSEEGGGLAQPQILWTIAVRPMDISFEVPEDLAPSQRHVSAEGPHGPLTVALVALPQGAEPGDFVTVRLGPQSSYLVTVPAGGQEATHEAPAGEKFRFRVPEGKLPGDQFEIDPRVLMVRVPEGAAPGDWVRFDAPGGSERMAPVPPGVPAGQYFDLPLDRSAI